MRDSYAILRFCQTLSTVPPAKPAIDAETEWDNFIASSRDDDSGRSLIASFFQRSVC